MGIGSQEQTAFAFEGSIKEFLPIAFSNVFLTLVTLGIYRFWATTRERTYLWSRTRFIDDRFEWTGTAVELLFGFLIVLAVFGLPFLFLNLLLQGLVFRGQGTLIGSLVGILYVALIYLSGVAIFRGQRYRLSRTYWHGIHGGTDQGGWRYGWSWIWKTVVAYLCVALLFPWSMTSLWKERWQAMSFGSHTFHSAPQWGSLMGRYLLAYLMPIGFLIALAIIAVPIVMLNNSGGNPAAMGLTLFAFVIAFYILLPLAALIYYAAYMREVIDTLSISTLEFEFTAKFGDWFKLYLGNTGIALLALIPAMVVASSFGLLAQFADVKPDENALTSNPFAYVALLVVFIIPLSLIGPFLRYRKWRFMVSHLEAGGEVNLETLLQSQTREVKQGEGLLDAFDLGAM